MRVAAYTVLILTLLLLAFACEPARAKELPPNRAAQAAAADASDPEVVFETQIIRAYPDPRPSPSQRRKAQKHKVVPPHEFR